MQLTTSTKVTGSYLAFVAPFEAMGKKEIEVGGDEIVKLAQEGATGGNKNMISKVPNGDFSVKVQAVGIAPIVQELGSVAHVIQPKNPNGWLHWIDPKTGQDVFAKMVNHPGTAAKPFLGPAALRYASIFVSNMRSGLAAVCRKLNATVKKAA